MEIRVLLIMGAGHITYLAADTDQDPPAELHSSQPIPPSPAQGPHRTPASTTSIVTITPTNASPTRAPFLTAPPPPDLLLADSVPPSTLYALPPSAAAQLLTDPTDSKTTPPGARRKIYAASGPLPMRSAPRSPKISPAKYPSGSLSARHTFRASTHKDLCPPGVEGMRVALENTQAANKVLEEKIERLNQTIADLKASAATQSSLQSPSLFLSRTLPQDADTQAFIFNTAQLFVAQQTQSFIEQATHLQQRNTFLQEELKRISNDNALYRKHVEELQQKLNALEQHERKLLEHIAFHEAAAARSARWTRPSPNQSVHSVTTSARSRSQIRAAAPTTPASTSWCSCFTSNRVTPAPARPSIGVSPPAGAGSAPAAKSR